MLHTIQADFYRLFRSKVLVQNFSNIKYYFWCFFGDTGHVGIQPPQK